jgi:hypothetical protein
MILFLKYAMGDKVWQFGLKDKIDNVDSRHYILQNITNIIK